MPDFISRSIRLLDKECPLLIEDLPAWFSSLSDEDLHGVCLSAVVTHVLEQCPEVDASALSASLLIVKDRMSGFVSSRPAYKTSRPRKATAPRRAHFS